MTAATAARAARGGIPLDFEPSRFVGMFEESIKDYAAHMEQAMAGDPTGRVQHDCV